MRKLPRIFFCVPVFPRQDRTLQRRHKAQLLSSIYRYSCSRSGNAGMTLPAFLSSVFVSNSSDFILSRIHSCITLNAYLDTRCAHPLLQASEQLETYPSVCLIMVVTILGRQPGGVRAPFKFPAAMTFHFLFFTQATNMLPPPSRFRTC